MYFEYKRMFASFWLNFSQKLANAPPGQNVGKHTPPPPKYGGLLSVRPTVRPVVVVRSVSVRPVVRLIITYMTSCNIRGMGTNAH